MNDKQLIKLYNNEKELSKEYNKLDRDIKALEKKMEKLGEKLYLIDRIDEIYKGFALEIFFCGTICKVLYDSKELERRAKFYKNCNDKKLTGVSIYTGDGFGYGKEIWKGASWPNREAAIIACKEWVCFGIEPGFNGVKNER